MSRSQTAAALVDRTLITVTGSWSRHSDLNRGPAVCETVPMLPSAWRLGARTRVARRAEHPDTWRGPRRWGKPPRASRKREQVRSSGILRPRFDASLLRLPSVRQTLSVGSRFQTRCDAAVMAEQ